MHHFKYAFSSFFQGPLCQFDFYPLQVFYWRIACGFDKPPVKIPPADRQFRGQFFKRDFSAQIFFDMDLSPGNQFISMVFLRLKNEKRRLGVSLHINLKNLCALDRY